MSVTGRSDLVDIAGTICGETAAAIRFNDGTRTVWLPKSQIETGELCVGQPGTIAMPEWLAKEKELI